MNIGIVGGGVIGLTTGVVLAEAGYDVEILTRASIEDTTSYAAAAISYPVSVEDSPRVNEWFVETNTELARLVKNKKAGVSWIDWHKYSKKPVCPLPSWMSYVKDARALKRDECPAPHLSGITARLLLMHVDEYCAYLMKRYEDAGGLYTIRDISDFDDLQSFDLLVNCTGVYARDLAGDKGVQPARGQVVIVKNPGITKHIAAFDSKNYLYPRGDQCLIGGSYDVGVWDIEIDDDLTDDILDWAAEIDPRLEDAEVLDVRVGLRPLRENVRLQLDRDSASVPIIHNYGHGGAGYTLSWGCAKDVLKIVGSV